MKLNAGVVHAGDRGAENQTGAGEVTQKLERSGVTTSLGWRKSEEGATAVHGLGPEERRWNQSGLFARTDSEEAQPFISEEDIARSWT